MVQTKKFEQTFLNEYLALIQREHDLLNQGRIEGRAEGRAEGIQKGRAEGSLYMCIDLIKSGLLSVKDAALKLGLSEDELKEKLS